MDTDTDLIIHCCEGEEEAWRLLLARYEAYVYGLCFRVIGSREEALDLTQEVLVKVLTGLDSFQLGRPFKPWLRQVAVNTCLNYIRSRGPKVFSLEQPVTGDTLLGETLAGSAEDPLAAAEWRDAREVIQEAISRLPPQQRIVLVLRHQEGLSYEEIAANTDLPLGTVKTYLFRARRQLRQKLASVYEWEG